MRWRGTRPPLLAAQATLPDPGDTRWSPSRGGTLILPDVTARRPVAAARTQRLAIDPYSLAAIVLYLAGVGALGTIFGDQPAFPFNYAAFWGAFGLALGGILLYGLRGPARARHQLLALAAYGVFTWLPEWLRSPTQAIFSDELFHLQIVQQIAELGRTAVPISFYPIPGEFPGLEFCALALAGATGLPLGIAARFLVLVNHALIPCIAYLTARGLGLGRRGAFLAALIYAANTSYYYFHAVFSYESLGVTFVITIWALMSRRQQRFGRRDFALAVPVALALAATHHFSSYILAATVVVAWMARRIVQRIGRGKLDIPTEQPGRWRAGVFGAFTLLTIVAPILWLFLFTTRAEQYLATSFVARITGIVTSLQRIIARESGGRTLFQGSPLPQWERLIDFLYVPTLVVLGLLGVGMILRRLGFRNAPAYALALAPCGPLAWFLTVPAVITPASELAYRSWPFLFLGLAMYAAIALLLIAGWLYSYRWTRPFAWPVVALPIALLLFCSVGIGDNQAGRFPVAIPTKAAGPETITPDLIDSAHWLERTAGRYNQVAGDGTTQSIIATVGFQKASDWNSWVPFFAVTTSEVSQFMHNTDTRFLTVDRRITTLPPRYGYYFSDAELYLPEARVGSRAIDDPIPPALIDKFDQVPDLARIYDNGNIQIFEYLPVLDGDMQPGSSASAPRGAR